MEEINDGRQVKDRWMNDERIFAISRGESSFVKEGGLSRGG